MKYFHTRNIIFIYLIILSVVIFSGLHIKNTYAACLRSDKNQGLISSAGTISGDFGNLSKICIEDPKAAYATFKVPTYNDLKTIFFDQAKQPATQVTKLEAASPYNISDANRVNISKSHIIHTSGDMTWNGTNPLYYNPGSGETTPLYNAIFFVDGNLIINSDVNYGSETSGIIFVVQNDVRIAPTVTNINAVIISEGNIFTAYDVTDGNATNPVFPINPLTINGSLLSITSTLGERIYFLRTLDDNSIPAEIVKFQPKYLVTLKGLLTQSFSIQKEITPDLVPAAVLPSPTTIASPVVAPSANPGSTLGNPFRIYTIYRLITQLRI